MIASGCGRRLAERWSLIQISIGTSTTGSSHCPQCLTAERLKVNADTKVHPELLNSRFGFISSSRALREAEVSTNNLIELQSRPGMDSSRSSALEFFHPAVEPTAAKNFIEQHKSRPSKLAKDNAHMYLKMVHL